MRYRCAGVPGHPDDRGSCVLTAGDLKEIAARAGRATELWLDDERWLVFDDLDLGPVAPFRRRGDARFAEHARWDIKRLLDEVFELTRLLLESHQERGRLEEQVQLLASSLESKFVVGQTGIPPDRARHVVQEMLRFNEDDPLS